MKTLLIGAALTCALAVAAGSSPVSKEPSLAAVKAATLRFQDVNVALAEGYVGVHYFRPDLLGITAPPNPRVDGTGTHTDFLKPGILIYEPQPDGGMKLVAVENLVFAKAWHAAGHKAPPTFHGRSYDNMRDDPATKVDEAHIF